MKDPNEAPWRLIYDGVEPQTDTLCHVVTLGPLDPDATGNCLQFYRTAYGPTSCFINVQGQSIEVELSPEAVASLSTFFANAAL